MKKIKTASVFLVLIMLFLSSCTGNKISEDTTGKLYNDSSEEYLPVYADNSSLDLSDLFDNTVECRSINKVEMYNDETLPKERTAVIFGEETTVYYENTQRQELLTDVYHIGSANRILSEGSVMFLHGTDTIVRVIKKPAEESGTELTEDEIIATAKDYAKEWCDFLNTDNFSTYCDFTKYGGSDICIVYFSRTINGIDTNDIIEVFVTKYGTVFGWGNTRNPYCKSVTDITVNMDLCRRSITRFVMQDSSILSTKSPEILKFKDKYSISFSYDGEIYVNNTATIKVGEDTIDILFHIKIGNMTDTTNSTDITMENSVVTNETAEIAAE